MDSPETEAFARRLMHEVWEAFNPEAVSRFYHRDVVGHHRGQTLSLADILNRLAWDQHHNAAPIFTGARKSILRLQPRAEARACR